MSTTPNHQIVATVYRALAELEGGSHSLHGLRNQLDLTEAGEPADAEIEQALWFLEAARLVDFQGSPAGLLWSLR